MSGRNTQIGGFVARQADTGHLSGQNLKQTIDNFALDYEGSNFVNAMNNGNNRYIKFEGRLQDIEDSSLISIPRGERFGGQHHDAPPCTLNGFIACRSDEVIPEFKILKGRDPENGSVIWVIENGEKRKAAVFDDEQMKFVPANEHDKRN